MLSRPQIFSVLFFFEGIGQYMFSKKLVLIWQTLLIIMSRACALSWEQIPVIRLLQKYKSLFFFPNSPIEWIYILLR